MRIVQRAWFEKFCFYITKFFPWQLRYATWLKFHGGCYECNRPYGEEYGFPDLVVPNDVWDKISPTGDSGGLLCPSCMCFRAHRLGLEGVRATFESGPFVNRDIPPADDKEGGERDD